jgi:DNA-binding CsgD family transcriptional regulator
MKTAERGGMHMITDAQQGVGKFDWHFRDAICRQDTLEAAAITLAEAANGLGWDLVAFHANIDTPDLPRTGQGQFIAERMGWPVAVLQGWGRFKLNRDCPVGSLCTRATEPFFWTCDDREADWYCGELGAENRRVLNYYGRFIADGLAVPVHRGARAGYVSWCSRNRCGRELASTNLGSMFFISHVFLRHVDELVAAQTRERGSGQLTEREIECLTWAARGQSEEAIALLLNRSRDTVHFHLQNAIKKLDAGNRTHAVAIACTRGLISLR